MVHSKKIIIHPQTEFIMNKKTVYSNVAIDLGGKYTGCVSYTSSILPSADDINAFIIEMPDDGNGIKYTVKDRT